MYLIILKNFEYELMDVAHRNGCVCNVIINFQLFSVNIYSEEIERKNIL
jgi:hypothetical protein